MKGTPQYPTNKSDFRELSHAVSHDLRAPIRTIEGFSQILIEDYADVIDDTGRTIIKTITESTAKLRASLEGLLEYSKLDHVVPEKQDLDLLTIINNIVVELNGNSTKEIEWEIELLSEKIYGDRILLTKLIREIISNAVKFSGKSAQPIVKILEKKNEEFKEIHIIDNGVGFDMKYLNKIFLLFGRLVGDSDFKGLGVGLAVALKIMRLHGGKIGVISQRNEGSTFVLQLPIK